MNEEKNKLRIQLEEEQENNDVQISIRYYEKELLKKDQYLNNLKE